MHAAEENNTAPQSPARWLIASLRSLLLLPAELRGLRASPLGVAALAAALLGLSVLLQYALLGGTALFDWQAIGSGWFTTLLLLWACWWVARSRGGASDSATLFALLLAQQLVISVPLWGLYLLAPWLGKLLGGAVGSGLQRSIPFVVVGWLALAGAVLLLRQAAGAALRLGVVALCVVAGGLDLVLPPQSFWYVEPGDTHAGAAVPARLQLTQELMEQQSATLVAALDGLQPQRAGVIDLYAITFAPYAAEDVFRRESQLVADVMQSRFDAQGRVIQLVNHAETAGVLPWATALNLQRAIQRAASLMDRNEDILFIHLSSHGAQDGKLATSFWPLELDAVTPAQLRAWLDAADVRFRVISVSACYAGAWVGALAEPGTLVMTASDADHSSYGCGRKSELTFFGRAMYDEQLRRTHSFEQAHAAARDAIAVREREAGKSDGYSNPQIAMGAAIRPQLAALAARLDAEAH